MHIGNTALAMGATVACAAVLWAAVDRDPPAENRPWAATVSAAPVVGDIAADTFRTIAEGQMPTVVSLRVSAQPTPAQPFPPELRRFFGLPDPGGEPYREGAGTGFVIDRTGLILTNNHVVEGASRIEVSFFPRPNADPGDVERLDARVLGRDPITDSALIQVEGAGDLPVARLGNSDDMRPGDWVMAIGNPFALSHTVTVGVISAHARPFPVEGRVQRVLQTDAAVNPGNSGGPLINLRGEVVGVNTAIISPAGTGNIGIGFAVPINFVRELIPRLQQGNIERGRLGVQIARLSDADARALGLPDRRGALVSAVEPGSPAERAGIAAGDVILGYNGDAIDDADELVTLVSNSAPGTQASLEVLRDRERRTVTVTIGTLSPAASAPAREEPSAARFGLQLAPLAPRAAAELQLPAGQTGVLVAAVTPGSPAAEAGLRPGDVIIEVNRESVSTVDAAAARFRATAPGTAALVLLIREGRQVFLTIAAP